MIDTVVVQPTTTDGEPSVAGVSWAAVTAGAVVSCALTLLLLTFGVGLGLSVVSPWSGAGVSAFKIGTGLYFIVIAMLSSSIGGYITGRLRSRWVSVHSDEVYFRDTAHGFVSWALASMLGVILLVTPAANLVGAGLGTAGQAAATASWSGPMDGYVDTLLRPASPSSQAQGADGSREEIGRLFTSSFRTGADIKANDREYVGKVVAARTGLSQADADKRVNDVIAQIKADTDAARRATAQLAFWLAASLLLGAFCASLAATEGGELRDGTPRSRKLSPAMRT